MPTALSSFVNDETRSSVFDLPLAGQILATLMNNRYSICKILRIDPSAILPGLAKS